MVVDIVGELSCCGGTVSTCCGPERKLIQSTAKTKPEDDQVERESGPCVREPTPIFGNTGITS